MTEDVLQGVNRKDMRAWEKLYKAYYAALCSYADGVVKERDVAEDVVQETLIRVWEGERVFSEWRDLTWYLYRAVYNNALYYLRRKQSGKEVVTHWEPEDMAEIEKIPDEQFEQTVSEELVRQVYCHLDALPDGQKKVILLSLQGHTGEDIAKILGVTIHTVKTQKSRAFSYLRERLKGSVLLFLI